MPPSLSAYFRRGNFCGTFDHTKSAAACTMFTGDSVMSTSIGASGAVITIFDDEPMCTHPTVSHSSAAAKNGSQWPEWIDGCPRCTGFSENVTAWQPLSATRRTSAAIFSGSHIIGIDSGMNRPGYAPHHDSMCQSLYARTSASAKASSCCAVRENSCPQNCGNDGKHIDPSTPLAFMSLTRSWML